MIKEQFDTTLAALKQQRDELKLQLHLLGMEAREEWQEAERVWVRLGQTLERIRQEGADQVGEMVEAFRELADDLSAYYQRLKPMEHLAEGLEDLRRMHDELKLQTHLMGMEVRAEWEEAEKGWNTLLARLDALKDKTGVALEEASEAARQVKEDLKCHYHNIKARLK